VQIDRRHRQEIISAVQCSDYFPLFSKMQITAAHGCPWLANSSKKMVGKLWENDTITILL
jgi:hypothetical protein